MPTCGKWVPRGAAALRFKLGRGRGYKVGQSDDVVDLIFSGGPEPTGLV